MPTDGILDDRAVAEAWIRSQVEPSGPIELAHLAPWSTVLRVPVAGDVVWFKACGPVQAFEPRLTAALARRSPACVTEVLACDESRAWMLMRDAGSPLGDVGNPPESWLELLPRYAELQRLEADHAAGHVEGGVPDLRLAALPERYAAFVGEPLPIGPEQTTRLRDFAPRLAVLCDELAAAGIPESIQHDDLHMANVYARDGHLRVLDWGDSSVAHPFFSPIVTFRFLREENGLAADDPWFDRLRDAYLEPWGTGLKEVFALAMRIGAFAHAVAWARQRAHLQASEHPDFDADYPTILGMALDGI